MAKSNIVPIRPDVPLPPQERMRKRIIDPAHSSLYFLAGAGLIKIGVTTNLTSRIRCIRNSSPAPLELLAIMPRATNFTALCSKRTKAITGA